jgi:hypothetical protein
LDDRWDCYSCLYLAKLSRVEQAGRSGALPASLAQLLAVV